jgi:hypothetical protein
LDVDKNYCKIKLGKCAFGNFVVRMAYLEKDEIKMHTQFLVRISEDKRPFGILGGMNISWVGLNRWIIKSSTGKPVNMIMELRLS